MCAKCKCLLIMIAKLLLSGQANVWFSYWILQNSIVDGVWTSAKWSMHTCSAVFLWRRSWFHGLQPGRKLLACLAPAGTKWPAFRSDLPSAPPVSSSFQILSWKPKTKTKQWNHIITCSRSLLYWDKAVWASSNRPTGRSWWFFWKRLYFWKATSKCLNTKRILPRRSRPVSVTCWSRNLW